MLDLTKLVTFTISAPENVVVESTRIPATNNVPVVFNCPFSCSLIVTIPEGYYAPKTNFGHFVGLWSTGINARIHFGYQCPALISQQAMVFNAPVKSCPTKDDVMVTIDVSVTLQIKEDEKDVFNFYYRMGPERLTDILFAFQQESVRTMARLKKYDNIYDLMESEDMKAEAILDAEQAALARAEKEGREIEADFASHLKAGDNVDETKLLDDTKKIMNQKLIDYGVLVSNITITNVSLPPRFAAQMENATAYDSKNNCAEARHRYNIMLIEDREKRMKNEQHMDEVLKEMKSKNNKSLAGELKKTSVYRAETNQQVSLINETKNSDVRQISTQSELKITLTEKEKQMVLSQISAETDATIVRVDTEVDAFVVQKKADTAEIVNSLMAEALAEQAKSEQVAASGLVAKRDFEAKMARLRILKNLALNGGISIVGTSDDNVAAQLLGTGGQNLALTV